jgi:hypothetical protein
LCFAARPATAENLFGPTEEEEAFIYVDLSFLLYSLIIAGGNYVYALGDERPSAGWRIQGWIAGTLNASMGIVLIALGKGTDDVFLNEDILVGFGVAHIVMGTLNIGFTIWSSSQPKRRRQNISLAPMIMPDMEGNPAVGIGMLLVDW